VQFKLIEPSAKNSQISLPAIYHSRNSAENQGFSAKFKAIEFAE
jgi:hypothetical protein